MEGSQLAVQLPVTDSTDFDALLHIENALILAFIDKSAAVDGHDIGQGKFNVFIVPKVAVNAVVDRIKVTLDGCGVLSESLIAHRPTVQGRYAVVWPDRYLGTFEL